MQKQLIEYKKDDKILGFFLLILCLGATSIANAHEMDLNTRLGTTNYKIVTDDNGATDTAYFKSEYRSTFLSNHGVSIFFAKMD